VTVEDSFNIAAPDAVNFAIGGKRKTLDADTSRTDPADWKEGWTIEFDTGTYDVQAEIACLGGTAATGPTVIRASSDATGRPTIRTEGSGYDLWVLNDTESSFVFEGLKFDTATNGGSGDVGIQLNAIDMHAQIIDCEFQTEGNCIFVTKNGSSFDLNNSTFSSVLRRCITSGGAADVHISATHCKFVGSGSGYTGINFNAGNASSLTLYENEIRGIATHGVFFEPDVSGMMVTIVNNTFVNCGSAGIYQNGTLLAGSGYKIKNNIFWSCGTYGIQASDANFAKVQIGPNAFGDNGTAATTNVLAHSSDINVASDPFVSLGSHDYKLNSAATGGALLRDTAVDIEGLA
tara:strand:+ start:5024 stop:6067 length:1044 start_codon:yes stop_codon:yes gene_type:complete